MDVTETIFLPKGVNDGQKIRLSQLGHCSDCYGSPNGDLLLAVKVKEHHCLKREGQDIVSEVPISFTQAILGDKVEIETVDGNAEINIEAGSQTNDEIKLGKTGAWEFNAQQDIYDS